MAINGAGAAEREAQKVWRALDSFRIEVPSWGFANTGTRFGKFVQAGAATTIEEKFSDASQVNALTGASPTVALHVLWDLPGGKADVPAIQGLEKKYGVKAGSINPNLFQDAEYKYGSIANPSAEIRGNALAHLLDSVEIGPGVGVQGRFAVDCRWVELSGNAEHTQADRIYGRGVDCDPCGAGRQPADAGGVQAV
jgi:L-rhamnose isomerase / sugar isomerase